MGAGDKIGRQAGRLANYLFLLVFLPRHTRHHAGKSWRAAGATWSTGAAFVIAGFTRLYDDIRALFDHWLHGFRGHHVYPLTENFFKLDACLPTYLL